MPSRWKNAPSARAATCTPAWRSSRSASKASSALGPAPGVWHEMQLRADPQDDVVEPGMGGHALGRDGAAIGHEPVIDERIVGDEAAHQRVQPVGADEELGLVDAAVGTTGARGVAEILDGDDLPICFERDALLLPAGVEQNGEQVTAMHDEVGMAVPAAEGVAEIERGDARAGERIHPDEPAGLDGMPSHRAGQAEAGEQYP